MSPPGKKRASDFTGIEPGELLNHVSEAFAGRCDRIDTRMLIGRTMREVCIYRMSDDLIRIDFKKPVI